MIRNDLSRGGRVLLAGALALLAAPALAHEGAHAAMSMATGFAHPFSGVDHWLAMLAVGLWAGQDRRSAQWVLPLVFPLAMALGAWLAISGAGFVGVEFGIAGSVAVLGLLIAFAVRMPLGASALLVAVFALAHGAAHGAELPQGTSVWGYGAGFLAATALLHLTGLAISRLASKTLFVRGVRFAGAGIAAVGTVMLAGTM